MGFLEQEIMLGLTGKQIVGALVGLFILGSILKRLGGENDAVKEHQVRKTCAGCGWAGTVSKFHKKCPKCGNTIT